MQDTSINFLLKSQKGETRGQATLRQVPRQAAVRKGVFAGLVCWGMALATLPIPIVHFVAPPLLLLLGPVVGFAIFKIYVGAVDIVRGEARCPDCSAAVVIGPCAERWPVDVSCPGCQTRLDAWPDDRKS